MESQPEDSPTWRAELKLRQRFRSDLPFYSEKNLWIRPKKGKLKPFILNKSQRYLHAIVEKQLLETGQVRIIVLKGRQQGISTYIQGRFYWKTTHNEGAQAFILTHEDKATKNLFKMAKRFHEKSLPMLRPETSSDSSKELQFENLDSSYAVGTAGTKAVGRSGTVQYFHGSEVAFWPNADTHSTGVMQSVPDEKDSKSEVFLESTANGIGNYFHEQWKIAERGGSDYIPVFLPWYWQDEYKRALPKDFQLTSEEFELLQMFKDDGLTPEHLNWRRYKTASFANSGDDGTWKFKQEYPFTADEAFQTSGGHVLIDPRIVLPARKRILQAAGPHIIGLDPSRFGNDPAAFVHRAGRKAWGLELHEKVSTMTLAGIAARKLRDPVTEEPTDVAMMFIDVGGLGAGTYDRLVELGFEEEGRICAVDFGGKAIQDSRYVNKRTEIWCEMGRWFELPGGVDIEDLDVLQGDICGPEYIYDSANRYVLERKEAMKKRGLPSPNAGDALALTFAEPVAPRESNRGRSTVQTISYAL